MGIRIFAAVDVPKETAARMQGLLRELEHAGARCVRSDQMHVTLAFMGEVNKLGLDGAKRAFGAIKQDAFVCKIRGVDSFDEQSPKVVFAKVIEGDRLVELSRAVRSTLREEGLFVEPESYNPHITLARVAQSSDIAQIKSFVEKHRNDYFGEFLCSGIKLKSSIMSEGRYVHEDIAAVSFSR